MSTQLRICVDYATLFYWANTIRKGFPGSSAGKNPLVVQKTQETQRVQSLGREDPLEEGIATHLSILALESPMDRGAWQATVHRVAQSRT